MTIPTTTKRSMALALGLILGGIGQVALAQDGAWISSSTAAYTEVAGTLLASNGADEDRYAYPTGTADDRYDPYTCAAAYGDAFCAAFERCMAVHGFETCYERISQ